MPTHQWPPHGWAGLPPYLELLQSYLFFASARDAHGASTERAGALRETVSSPHLLILGSSSFSGVPLPCSRPLHFKF
ncbi:hypothetical protein AV530_018903 [Patagioenas fasciata monilis]|uniref:Uncharacterized protein n=1 Tax=Patagioenas fasciata monilis TaxID=372326 RepID=A0A1V4JJY2_PATFA|nr:hypothetical protein AV530_018903 [Patagioenas fasciata monilis]